MVSGPSGKLIHEMSLTAACAVFRPVLPGSGLLILENEYSLRMRKPN